MATQQNVYSFSHKSMPHPSMNRLRALRKKRRMRKKARDILAERYKSYSVNRVNMLSILGLVAIFIVLFYLSPHS